jgi:hypothetical protein
MSTVIHVDMGPDGQKGQAVLWLKNGDHPEDGPAEQEGKVVCYYRNPEVKGVTVCNECGKTFHEHGWIDTSIYIVKNTVASMDEGVVCPGTWIMSYSWDDGKGYHLTDKLGFIYTLFHTEAMKNKAYATNFLLRVTLNTALKKYLEDMKVKAMLDQLLTNPFNRHKLNLCIDDRGALASLSMMNKDFPDYVSKNILVCLHE